MCFFDVYVFAVFLHALNVFVFGQCVCMTVKDFVILAAIARGALAAARGPLGVCWEGARRLQGGRQQFYCT